MCVVKRRCFFNTLPPSEWPANIAALMPAATQDYIQGQQAVIDTPEGNSNLGMLAYNQGDAAKQINTLHMR